MKSPILTNSNPIEQAPRAVFVPFALLIAFLMTPAPLLADAFDCRGCIDHKDIGKKQVRKLHVKKGTVVSRTVKNRSLKAKDLADGTLTDGQIAPGAIGFANVIHVSPSGGDFNDPRAAVESIADASDAKRYVVHIGPGFYELGNAPLVMKEYVDVRGAGQEVVFVRGSVDGGAPPADAGVIFGANHATLSDLSVSNSAPGAGSAAGVLARDLDGSSPSSFRMERLTAKGSGGGISYGVLNRSSSPVLVQVEAGAGGNNTAIGVDNRSSSPEMTNVTAEGTGGNGFGMVYDAASTPVVRDSYFEGTNEGVGGLGQDATIVNTIIVEGISAGAECANVYDENLAPIVCP